MTDLKSEYMSASQNSVFPMERAEDCHGTIAVSDAKRRRYMLPCTTEAEIKTPGISKEKVDGGLLTSRIPRGWQIPVPREFRAARFKIELSQTNILPQFQGCPNWIKNLMYFEYQVIARLLCRIQNSTDTFIPLLNSTDGSL